MQKERERHTERINRGEKRERELEKGRERVSE
jgi:hypothetical protein